MTGRKGRVVSNDDGTVSYESRSKQDVPLEILNIAEKKRFMDGEKVRQTVFSRPLVKYSVKWVSVLRRPQATLQLHSYSTFFKILSQWLLYKEQHSMKYLHFKDHLSYVYKQLRKRLKQDVQNAFNSALLHGWKFRRVGDERLEIMQFHHIRK